MVRILLQQIRRDRVTLPIWIIGTALLLTVAASSVLKEYGDTDGRIAILKVALATPALLALRGIPNGDSLGSAVHFQSYAFLAVTIGLMNTFLATRHGRADEEKGRRELVLAAPVRRITPPIATLILGVIANSIFGVIAALGYVSVGLDVQGSILSAVALAMTGLAFLGIGMVAGELTATSRAANGVGVVLVLLAYALRAAGDADGTPDLDKLTLQAAWPSWLSPIGWGQQTLAFTENRWWPVAALAGLAVVAAVVALLAHSRRELGASLFAERSGRASALPTLGSPVGLAWRLTWPTLIAWAGGSALLGLVLPSLANAVAGVSLGNPQIVAILESLGHTSKADITTTLVASIMVLIGVLAAAAGVQAVLRLRDDETEGRTEEVLATRASRWGWTLAFTLIGAVAVLTVLVGTGLAAALGFGALGDSDSAWRSLGQALVQAPAALTFVGLTALLVGLLPRLAIGLGWGLYGVGVGIGLFGGLLNLPDGFERISPIANVPSLPTDHWGPTVLLGAIAIVLAVLGAGAFRRRDLTT